MTMQLSWSGFKAAVDLIAAQCRWRDRAGVHGGDLCGQLLAHALALRLGLNVLADAGPGVLLVYGVVRTPPAAEWAWPDVDVWVWVDATAEQRLQSVVKVCGDGAILLPWESDDEGPLPLKR